MKIQESGEDYLEAILVLQEKKGHVPTPSTSPTTWSFPNPASAGP